MLQLEKKLFDYFNQEVFREDNGTAVSSMDGRTTLSLGWRLPWPQSHQEHASWCCHSPGWLLNPHSPVSSLLGQFCCDPLSCRPLGPCL